VTSGASLCDPAGVQYNQENDGSIFAELLSDRDVQLISQQLQELAETQALDCSIFGFVVELGISRHQIHLPLALDAVPRIGEPKEFGKLFSQAGLVQ
jgi:hypothetical protein